MKVDVCQTLKALDGTDIMDGAEGREREPAMLRTICITALMATLEEDRNLSGEDKLQAWTLAKKIQDDDLVDLIPEELSKLKERVGKVFGPAVVGPAYQILNDPTEIKEK